MDDSLISSHKKLSSLTITDCGVSDISFLSEMTHLTKIDMDENNISDISVLSKLGNLKYLSLENNNVSDIAPLQHLINLRTIDLTGNPLNWKAYSTYLPSLNAQYEYMTIKPSPNRNAFYIFLTISLLIPMAGILCLRNHCKELHLKHIANGGHKSLWGILIRRLAFILLPLIVLDLCCGSYNPMNYILFIPLSDMLHLGVTMFKNPNHYIELFEVRNMYGFLFRLHIQIIFILLLPLPIYLSRGAEKKSVKIMFIIAGSLLIIIYCLFLGLYHLLSNIRFE